MIRKRSDDGCHDAEGNHRAPPTHDKSISGWPGQLPAVCSIANRGMGMNTARKELIERTNGGAAVIAHGVGAIIVLAAIVGGCALCGAGCKRTSIRIPRPPAVEVAR